MEFWTSACAHCADNKCSISRRNRDTYHTVCNCNSKFSSLFYHSTFHLLIAKPPNFERNRRLVGRKCLPRIIPSCRRTNFSSDATKTVCTFHNQLTIGFIFNTTRKISPPMSCANASCTHCGCHLVAGSRCRKRCLLHLTAFVASTDGSRLDTTPTICQSCACRDQCWQHGAHYKNCSKLARRGFTATSVTRRHSHRPSDRHSCHLTSPSNYAFTNTPLAASCLNWYDAHPSRLHHVLSKYVPHLALTDVLLGGEILHAQAKKRRCIKKTLGLK